MRRERDHVPTKGGHNPQHIRHPNQERSKTNNHPTPPYVDGAWWHLATGPPSTGRLGDVLKPTPYHTTEIIATSSP